MVHEPLCLVAEFPRLRAGEPSMGGRSRSYTHRIVGNFFANNFDRQRAVVRIGTSGKGIIPNYAIEQGGEAGGLFELRHCFHGRNHKEILEDSFQGENWSSAAMSCTEVQNLLGELRKKAKS
jgi:hypothetical protein